MKRLFVAWAIALSLLTPVLHALAADQAPDASAADQAAALQKMQEQLKQMQQEMDQIHSTQDPTKRRALMQQHWQSMMQGMQMMHQCCGGPMMGQMGMGGPGCCAGGMHGHMMNPEMMQNRMDMMQMMMDQMMQHQQMMQPSK